MRVILRVTNQLTGKDRTNPAKAAIRIGRAVPWPELSVAVTNMPMIVVLIIK